MGWLWRLTNFLNSSTVAPYCYLKRCVPAPYWLDDKSLRQSIENSGAGSVLLPPRGFHVNTNYSHVLPHDADPSRLEKADEVTSRPYRPAPPDGGPSNGRVAESGDLWRRQSNQYYGALLEDGECPAITSCQWASEGAMTALRARRSTETILCQ